MNKTNESMLYSQALAFASEKHAGQVRKDGSPYILHPIRVSKMISDAGYNIQYQIAGLFHDLLEDTDASEDEILVYGEDVLEATKLVSKNYCKEKKNYISNILENHMAAVVKNADRIDNLWEACYGEEKFQKGYLQNSKKEYEGKFSKALDLSIIRLDRKMRCNDSSQKKEYPEYDYEYMELYSDKEKRAAIENENRIKKLIEISKTCEKPNRNNPELVYYEANDNYYCAYEQEGKYKPSMTWMLTEAGWIPTDIDLFNMYGYDLDRVDRGFVLEEFYNRKENGTILQFVTEDDI